MKKRLALVNYNAEHFWPFMEKLQASGFEVFWINSRPISSEAMRRHGAAPERICDILEGPSRVQEVKQVIDILKEYEQDGLPTINSIVFMDQNLRNADYASAITYLANGALKIREFLVDNEIAFISSGRDTGIQMLTMLICKKLGIWWGCVTRPKLPKEHFGFSPTQQGDAFIPLREASDADYKSAREWLEKYRLDVGMKPNARPKIEGVAALLKKIPLYLSVFRAHLEQRIKTSSDEKIPGGGPAGHIGRHFEELINYASYRLFLAFDQPGDEPFVLYGLHRQPESSIDVRGAFFDDQLSLIKQIVRSIPVTHKLYVKMHFSDVAGQSYRFYKTLRRYPGVKLIDPDVNSRDLITRAAVIVTNVGAMGQEGGYLGRHVIAVSKMFWNDLPTVVYCGTPAELPAIIYRMIASPPVDDFEAVARCIARYMANSFPCDPNLGYMNSSFSSKELETLVEAYEHVYKSISRQQASYRE